MCDRCGRKFARKYDMEKHRKLHIRPAEHHPHKRPRLASSTDSGEGDSLCCDASHSVGSRCNRRAVVVHEGHYDFLLSCGTLQCKRSDEQSSSACSDDAEHSHDCKHDENKEAAVSSQVSSPSAACPVTACKSPGKCSHVQNAMQVFHDGHVDYVLDGHLWHKKQDGFENHGSFELLDINQDFLTFYESLEQM